MLDALRARMARRSFDFQWGSLPEGSGLLSDPYFEREVDRILSEEELRIERSWFPGRRVLDAGCGNGRWLEGFLRLGCEVTALDASANALDHVRRTYGDRVRTVAGDVLRADEALGGERFDLVFSWGVLHHTSDTAGGIRTLGGLVKPDGLLYLYLYGSASQGAAESILLNTQRVAMNLLPLPVRKRVIERRYGKERAHEVFDLISTPLNRRFTFDEAEAMCRDAGFGRALQTMPHPEVFIRADSGSSSADGHTLPQKPRPYWFEARPSGG